MGHSRPSPLRLLHSYENQQQEWIENLTSGALIEVNNRKCLCPDTRNSLTSTTSASVSSLPLASPSQMPSVGRSQTPSTTPSKSRVPAPSSAQNSGGNVGLGVGLGLGLPLALVALGVAGLFGYSAYSGTPVAAVVGKVTGGLLGSKTTTVPVKLAGSASNSAASASRVSQLGRASAVTTDAAAPDTTSLLRGAVKPGSWRYGGL